MIRILVALLFVPVAAVAAEPDAAISALADMSTRYTIGPWEGIQQGDVCLLANSEPLNLAGFELTAPLEHNTITLRLTPAVPQLVAGSSVSVQVDGNAPEELPYRSDEGGFAMAVPPAILGQMKAGRFLSVGDYRFDLHGFARAAAIFDSCINKHLPSDLPLEQITESDLAQVPGSDWQLMTLTLGNYRYAAYAMLGETGLGLWVHNVDSFVISFTGVAADNVFSVSLNGREVAAVPQQDGVLVPLSAEVLRQLEDAGTLEVKIADTARGYNLRDFRQVVVALQPYE